MYININTTNFVVYHIVRKHGSNHQHRPYNVLIKKVMKTRTFINHDKSFLELQNQVLILRKPYNRFYKKTRIKLNLFRF